MMQSMQNRHSGFTVVELMVTIAIVGILAAIAAPSFIGVVNTNRLASNANELLSIIQYARSEAVRSNSRVIFCGSLLDDAIDEDDCSAGERPYWVVLGRDEDGDWRQLRQIEVQLPVRAKTAVEKIIFGADGLGRDEDGALSVGTITVCMPTTNPARNKREVRIASGGRVVVATPEVDGGGVCG
jgi:type IV fimbrial biogenesis protein FimT